MALNTFSHSASTNAFVYTDLQGLESIKRQAATDEDAALRVVAQQFEAMFTQLIMKSMREATKTLNPDSFLTSYETEFYEQMLDEQMSLNMAQQGGMGLADVLYEQLSTQARRAQGGNVSPDVLPLDRHGRPILPAQLRAPEGAEPISRRTAPVAPAESAPITAPELGQVYSDQQQAIFNSPAEFVQAVWPYAVSTAAELNADPRYLVAQAALETGWGRYVIQRDDGQSSHNLFNIKADRRWSGESAEVTTREYFSGRPTYVQAAFRAYDSIAASFADYQRFVTNSPRYASALAVASDGAAYAQALQAAGYATDPAYADKIQRIAEGATLNDALQQVVATVGGQP